MTIQTNEDLQKFIRAAFPSLNNEFIYGYIMEERIPKQKVRRIIVLLFAIKLKIKIKRDIEKYIRGIDSSIDEISYVYGEETLTEATLLRYIKSAQAMKLQDITRSIKKDGIDTNQKRISNMIDSLRKNDYLHRSSNGAYLLTEKGLSTVPHGNFKNSSDITRALVLGKQRW